MIIKHANITTFIKIKNLFLLQRDAIKQLKDYNINKDFSFIYFCKGKS